MPRVKVTGNLKGWKAVHKAFVSGSARVKVGILTGGEHEARETNASKAAATISPGEVAPQTGISMIELAAIHEFGAPEANIPERSFIRSTFRRERTVLNEKIKKFVGDGVKAVLARGTPTNEGAVRAESRKALGKVGQVAVAMVKKTIREKLTEGPEPQQNKPETIRRKGSSTPLVDSGQLINAVTYELVDGEVE